MMEDELGKPVWERLPGWCPCGRMCHVSHGTAELHVYPSLKEDMRARARAASEVPPCDVCACVMCALAADTVKLWLAGVPRWKAADEVLNDHVRKDGRCHDRLRLILSMSESVVQDDVISRAEVILKRAQAETA